MKMKHYFKAAALGVILSSLSFTPLHAQSVYNKDGATLDFNFEAAAIYVKSDSTYFGAGQGGTGDKDIYWTEYYMKPSLNATYKLGNSDSLYASFAAIGEATRGDGDINSPDRDDDMAIDNAVIGWKSGKMFEQEDLLDISAGRQQFLVGRGFIMKKQGGDDPASYWLAPNNHFDNTAIARINWKPVRADFAWVDTNDESSDSKTYGVNLEYFNDTFAALDQATLAVAYFKTDKSDYEGWDGLNVYDIRANFAPLAAAGNSDLYISAEYAKQKNDSSYDVDADAYFAELGYNFSKITWTPKLFYRYEHFSGDDPSTPEDENYQYYFEGATGWGTWYTEILGDYYGFNNSNQHQVQLEIHPAEALSAGIIYYTLEADESGDKIGDEINIYADYMINQWVAIGGCYAWATPDTVAESDFGDEDAQKIELYTYIYF